MDFEELIASNFEVTDALEPACRTALVSIVQRLDIPPARASMTRGEAARVEVARQRALADALSMTWALLPASHFDIQVLSVLMRLQVELDGVGGIDKTLQLATAILCQYRRIAGVRMSASEAEKCNRLWSRYFDAVFLQAYEWLARNNELGAAQLSDALATLGEQLMQRLLAVDAALSVAGLRSGGFARFRDLVETITAGATLDNSEDAPPKRRAEPTEPKVDESTATRSGSEVVPEARSELDALAPQDTNENPRSENVDTVQVSPKYWELQRAMRAMAQLLDAGKYEKASIIAADLEETLRTFSVQSYFPLLFAPLFVLMARYSQPLQYNVGRDSIRTSALTQLYRSDLNRFMSLAIEEHG